MNLSEIKKYLAKAGLHADRKFSQNFLFNDDVLHRIIDLVPSDKGFYVEIGGGLGSLTEKAVQKKLSPKSGMRKNKIEKLKLEKTILIKQRCSVKKAIFISPK